MKTFLLALPLALGALLVPATTASANQPFVVANHHVHYDVLYRTCPNEPWQFYGRYGFSDQAHHAAHHLQHRGFETFIRAHHGY